MIQIIFGKKGSGKTKRILDMANASVKEAKGNVLFVDDDKSYTLSLKPQIRFIDASEYEVKGTDPFYGFLAGILAGNYDIGVIYIDAFLKLPVAVDRCGAVRRGGGAQQQRERQREEHQEGFQLHWERLLSPCLGVVNRIPHL